MNRTKRTCFAGSVAVHGALLLIVIFGSAFFTSTKQADTFDPTNVMRLTDLPSSTPNPSVEPPPPPPEARPETRAEPAPEPPVHVVKATPKPPKPEPEETDDSPAVTDKGTLPKPPPKKKAVAKHPSLKPKTHHPDINLDHLVEKKVAKPEDDSGETRAQEQRRHELANAINEAKSTITKEGSKSTDIGFVGNLGPAFANYNQMIYSAYKAKYDEEVLQAGEFATEESSVRVSITISRDGSVIESKLVSRSGNRTLDELVRRVLRKVKFIAPFPAEAKDSERTFDIQFNLKPNGQLG